MPPLAGRIEEARVLAPFYGRINPSTGSVGAWIAGISGSAPERRAWKGQMLEASWLCNPDDPDVKAAWEEWSRN